MLLYFCLKYEVLFTRSDKSTEEMTRTEKDNDDGQRSFAFKNLPAIWYRRGLRMRSIPENLKAKVKFDC